MPDYAAMFGRGWVASVLEACHAGVQTAHVHLDFMLKQAHYNISAKPSTTVGGPLRPGGGNDLQVLRAAWNNFDKWASACLGLDESKFEWAIIEKELQDEQDLSDIANDNMAATERISALEAGTTGTELVNRQPDIAQPRMDRGSAYQEI